MRRLAVFAGLGAVVVGFGCLPGCKRNLVPDPPAAVTTEKPTAAQLVAFLNENSRLVQSIKSPSVEIQAKQGGQTAPGLTGSLSCQKPRDFRLRGDCAGKQVVDIGSNDNEFWYWISEDRDPKDNVARLHYCSYQDMAAGKAQMPFPFQPDLIVAALGMGEFDPNKEYTLKEDARTLSLIEKASSAQGQPVQKVVVFNKTRVGPNKPQILAYLLLDEKGNEICRASIQDVQAVQINRDATVVLPQRVQLVWKPQQMEMSMRLYDMQVNSIEAASAAKLFSRVNLSIPAVNLAQGPDAPSGYSQEMSLQRTVLTAPVK